MPFATNGQISQSPIHDGIEITQEQYGEALAGMLAGKVVAIMDGELILHLPDEPPPGPEPEPPTLEDAIAAKLAELDDHRWQMEISGAEFGGGMIRTDWNSQNKIAAAYIMAINDPEYVIPTWEVVPGVFVSLDNETIRSLGVTVRDHVQETFNRKSTLYPLISSLTTIEEVEAFDIDYEWDNYET
jgi:hypothetical protein